MCRYLKNERGITIITLAVTIIVMLILSAVAINVGIGEDGIINRAENAVDKYKEAAQNEKEAMDSISSQLDDILSGIDNPVEDIDESPVIEIIGWNSTGGIVTLEVKEGYKAEYQIEGEEWSNYTEGSQITVENGKKISVRYYTDEGIKGKIASKIIRDEIAPNIEVSIEEQTSSTIKVKATAEDKEMGIDEELGYKYYIRKTGEKEYEYKGQNTTGEYEYTNLEAQTNYEILVTANDLGGNTGSGKAEGITEEGEAPTLVEGQNIRITKTPDVLTKENVIVKVELIGIDSKYYIEYSEGNTSNYVRYNNQIEVENNETIYVRINDGNKASNAIQVNIDNIDKELPQVQVGLGSKTSNSITVNIEVTDNEGELEGQEYVYKIKKTTETSYTQTYTSTNKTYVFTNLIQNTGYDIEVEAKDVVGNVGKGNLLNQVTEEVTSGLVEGAIVFSNPTWSTNGTASIKISTNTSYQIEYQKNGTEGTWTKIENEGIISSLNHNDTVYARLTDGINQGEYASTSIKDMNQPEVSISLGTITSNSIGVTVTANDRETGLSTSNTYEYFLNGTTQGASISNIHTFSNLLDETEYTLKVKVTDKAGNSKEATVEGTTNKVPSGLEEGAIIFSNPIWIDNQASISIKTNTSYKLQYQINQIVEENWMTITNGEKITGLKEGDRIYARLTDGINYGDYASIEVINNIIVRVNNKGYNTLQDAINDVQDGEEKISIEILENIEECEIIVDGNKNIEINMNNSFSIMNNKEQPIFNLLGEGEISIINGTIIGNYNTDVPIIKVNKNSKLILQNTMIEAQQSQCEAIQLYGSLTMENSMISNDYGSAIYTYEGYNTNIEIYDNSIIESKAFDKPTILNYGNINLYGGYIESENYYSIQNESSGIVKILDSSVGVYSYNNHTIYNEGTLDVQDGDVIAENGYYGIYNLNGVVNITGGNISSKYGC